jgi:diphosphomevalonate decarboxylase
VLNGKEIEVQGRHKEALDFFREAYEEETGLIFESKIEVESVNNFPTAAGMASSASGFACLVLALAQAFDYKFEDNSEKE